MENTAKNKRGSAIKYFAIATFIGLVVLISWFSVQLVNNMPGAFSSLASLAENIKQYPNSSETGDSEKLENTLFTVTSNKTLVNSGDLVNISWNTTKTPGSYTFYYECDSGIAMDIIKENEEPRFIGCGKNYNIGNTDSLTLHVESERVRFEDINYTVAFLGTNDIAPRASGSSSFTIINNNIPDELTISFDEISKTDSEIAQNEETNSEENKTETISENTNPDTSVETETPATTNTPIYVQEFTYEIPTSNPNGRTDLSTKFIATGNILSNIFIPGDIYENEDGAIQFEVKNYGTKTSEEWTFSISLPNGGEYVSKEQEPLKPNERAVLTIGFTASEISKYTFVVEINEPTDKNSANDDFSQTVYFVD